MCAGYSVTVTNRLEDFPAGCRVHPIEMRDILALKMTTKIREGRYSPQPVDGPNLWRLKVGDRLAWVCPEPPGHSSTEGLLAIVEFEECALAIGEGAGDLEGFWLCCSFSYKCMQRLSPTAKLPSNS